KIYYFLTISAGQDAGLRPTDDLHYRRFEQSPSRAPGKRLSSPLASLEVVSVSPHQCVARVDVPAADLALERQPRAGDVVRDEAAAAARDVLQKPFPIKDKTAD